MYHHYSKNDQYLRKALYEEYDKKCFYCGDTLQPKNMHVDHILASNYQHNSDETFNDYLNELIQNGFIFDCVENYFPTCSSCNLKKNNKNFSTSNLRFFHQQAQDKTASILNKIEIYKNKCCNFPNLEVKDDSWEELDFSYQRNISYAILGYRLTPADVTACPRFPQIEEVKKRLSIVDYVIVQGEPGCGKSISIYQTAYDFYNKGWRVFKYLNNNRNEYITLPSIDGNTLYIVDDSQNLPQFIIEKICLQANNNNKIILGQTICEKDSYETITITNNDSIKAMSNDYCKRKNEIIPIVHLLDKNIGNNYFDTPLEYRLLNAEKANTPWQFNYILRGGWQSMRSTYCSIYKHKKCGFLSAIIACFQILFLDDIVDCEKLFELIQSIDDSITLDKEDIGYLIDHKIIASQDDLRIVHIESANIIVAYFLKFSSQNEITLLQKIIEKACIQKQYSPLGLVWFLNGVSRYYNHLKLEEIIISQNMIDSILENIKDITDATKQAHVIYFMDKIFKSPFERNGLWYFKKNTIIIAEWISNTHKDNAYSFSIIVNDLINYNKVSHRKFVNKINWDTFCSSLSQTPYDNLYSWGKLIDRLLYNSTKAQQKTIGEKITNSLSHILEKTNSNNIDELAVFLSKIYFYAPDFVTNTIIKFVPIFELYFKRDIKKALDVFDFDFMTAICGVNFWYGYKPTINQQKATKAIMNVFPEEQFSIFISNSLPRDWHAIYDVMFLINYVNSKKAKEIIDLVDLVQLDNITNNLWEETSDDLFILVHSIAIGNLTKAREYLRSKKHLIKKLQLPFIEISPEDTIQMYKDGITVLLLKNHNYKDTQEAIKSLHKSNPTISKEIFQKNIPYFVSDINNISEINVENNDFISMLKTIDIYYPVELINIFSSIDIDAISLRVIRINKNKLTNPKQLANLKNILLFIEEKSPEFISKQIATLYSKLI